MRDFLCFSSQEKKFLKNSTQTKKSKTFTLTKITYKKCVHFHAREEVREEFHANQEVEEIFSRKNKQHLVGVATFPKRCDSTYSTCLPIQILVRYNKSFIGLGFETNLYFCNLTLCSNIYSKVFIRGIRFNHLLPPFKPPPAPPWLRANFRKIIFLNFQKQTTTVDFLYNALNTPLLSPMVQSKFFEKGLGVFKPNTTVHTEGIHINSESSFHSRNIC